MRPRAKHREFGQARWPERNLGLQSREFHLRKYVMKPFWKKENTLVGEAKL